MAHSVTLDEFVEAFSQVLGEKYAPDSWLWADAHIDDEEWGWLSIDLLSQLGCEARCEANISAYLPKWSGYWLRRPEFADIKLKEVYAFCEFAA